jgi:hypothetical protein
MLQVSVCKLSQLSLAQACRRCTDTCHYKVLQADSWPVVGDCSLQCSMQSMQTLYLYNTSWMGAQHSVMQPGLSASTACLAQRTQHSMHSIACTSQHENAHQQSPSQVTECKPAAHTHCCPPHLSIQTGKWRQYVILHMGLWTLR